MGTKWRGEVHRLGSVVNLLNLGSAELGSYLLLFPNQLCVMLRRFGEGNGRIR
jgi:hypothetical protein